MESITRFFKNVNLALTSYFDHPTNVGMTYSQHALASLYLSKSFLVGACKGLVHAVYPDVLTTFAQDTLEKTAIILSESTNNHKPVNNNSTNNDTDSEKTD